MNEKGNTMAQDTDPFGDDYEAPASADRITLDSVGDWVRLKVTEVSEPFEAEHGWVFTVTGTVVASGGDTVVAPDKGAEGSFLMAWNKVDKKTGKETLGHVREETIRAIKAEGRRSGSIEYGDDIAWKRDEDVTHSKGGKKFPFPFRHHIVRVMELGGQEDQTEIPF